MSERPLPTAAARHLPLATVLALGIALSAGTLAGDLQDQAPEQAPERKDAPAEEAAAEDSGAPVEIVPADESIVPPSIRIETQHAPVYPPAAKGARMSGAVIVQAEIGLDGKVTRVAVVESTHPNLGFEEAAMAAVRTWEFRPAHRIETGEPVVYVTQYRLTFGDVDPRPDERPRMIAGGVPAPSRDPARGTEGARDASADSSRGGSRR